MSIKMMTTAWELDGLNPGQKFVLIALCDNASDEGHCWPSIETIAGKCSMGVRTVQRHVVDLAEMGLLSVHVRPGKTDLFTVNPRQIGTPAKLAPLPKTTGTPANLASSYISEPSKNRQSKGRTSKRAPDDFSLTVEMMVWASEKAPLVAVVDETDCMRDHEFKTARSDWPATWRQWMRTAQKKAAESQEKARALESFRERDARLAAERVREATGGLCHDRKATGEKPRELLPFERGYVAPSNTIEGEAHEHRITA